MLLSELFTKTLRSAPKDAISVNHQFLVRAGYIDQLTSGAWSLLPLGWKVYCKVENIIREEINTLGAQEVFLPALGSKELWSETGRWETIDPPLFKFQDRHQKWLALGSTHEEVITDLARKQIESYKDLPKAIYQIQNKFRNEMRSTGGLLRTREFIMKDLYSFHATEKDLDQFYQKTIKVYHRIFKRCGIKAVKVEACSGSIGGSLSSEFMILADSGEDRIMICPKCDWAANIEIGKKNKCPKCQSKIIEKRAIEGGHVFKLGTTYSKKMKAEFIDQDGRSKPILMGCYGIGLQRLMATIVEASHDEQGIIWPASVAPFTIYLVGLDLNNSSVKARAKKIYQELSKDYEVLFDNRSDSAGVKFKDADLLGIPVRLVISKKTGSQIEFKFRNEKNSQLLDLKQISAKLKKIIEK